MEITKNKQLKGNPESMQELIDTTGFSLIPIKIGEMVDVTILVVSRNKITVDVGGLTTGFIPEKEFSSDILELKPGDKIPAMVLMLENEEKQVVLSLKRANKERYWQKLQEVFGSGEGVKVRVREANRGGLMVEYGNIEGFLPVSHLSSEHYPKVGNQRDKILAKLKTLINNSLTVKVITLEQSSSKVVFSEKEAGDKALEEKVKKLKVGQQFTSSVTGIVDFGIFVSLSLSKNTDEIEGLVHISEISWNRVDDINKLYKLGDKVNVEIIDINQNKIFLSIKRLQTDPWLDLIKKYHVGDEIKGTITKMTPYGAFVSIEGKITGMFHISELAVINNEKIQKIEDLLELKKEYNFVINSIEPKAHKIGLSWPTKKVKKKTVKDEKSKNKVLKKPTSKKSTKKSNNAKKSK